MMSLKDIVKAFCFLFKGNFRFKNINFLANPYIAAQLGKPADFIVEAKLHLK